MAPHKLLHEHQGMATRNTGTAKLFRGKQLSNNEHMTTYKHSSLS